MDDEIKRCPECLSKERLSAKFCSECAYSFCNPKSYFHITRFLTISTFLRIVIAGVLLNALLPQINEYFYFLRFGVCFTSAYLIYVAIVTRNYAWIVLFLFLIILFNPFVLPEIRRFYWKIVDVVTAVGMLISIFFVGEKFRALPTTAE